jgi:methionine sulfoxide reductase heme-binding subunit
VSPAASHLLWYLSRGSGLVLLVLMSVVVVLGAAVHLRAAPPNWPRFALVEFHRFLSLLAVALLGLHAVTAIVDPYVTIGWAAGVVPFTSPYRPLWVGLGAVAVDLGAAVLLTSLLRHRLGFRAWKAVHWLAYLAWPAAVAHSLGSGNDLRVGWVAATVGVCVAAVAMAAGARLFTMVQRSDGPAPDGKSSSPEPRLVFEKAT